MRATNVAALAVLAAFCLACIPGSARADFVVNGGFEDPHLPDGTTFYTVPPNLLNGWTVGDGANASPGTGSVDLIQTYWTPSELTQSLDLDGNLPGSIYQTLNTTPGAWYELTFYYSNNPDGHPNGSWSPPPSGYPSMPTGPSATVTVGSLTLNITDSDTTNTRSDMHWQLGTGLFQASGASTVLMFQSTSAAGNPFGIALDNISVQPSVTTGALPVVPEAGSLAIWSVLGLSVMGWSRRHRSH